MKTVLNVGGGSKQIPIPAYYDGWEHHLLDIDARVKPDVVMDARELSTLPAATYDAVYCSHNLEHYHRGDGAKVLRGFFHVLKEGGFADIRVPDVLAVIKHVAQNGLDLDDTLYQVPNGPTVMVRDVFYGYSVQVEQLGNEFYAHKTGFSPQSLIRFVQGNGFHSLVVGSVEFELMAYLFKGPPSEELYTMLGLDPATRVP